MQYTVEFTNVNDPYPRYFVVCADKQWGQPGCQPWTGDWVDVGAEEAISPPILAKQMITAVTSSDAGYYYSVRILDSNGNVVKECQHVDRYSPCVYSISTATPTPTPTYSPAPTPTPTPTPSPLCPPGTSCMDTPVCIQADGTCVSSCQYGCCCQLPTPTSTPRPAPSPTTPTPTPTYSPAPTPTSPTSKLSWETIALIGAGVVLGGTVIALARKRR